MKERTFTIDGGPQDFPPGSLAWSKAMLQRIRSLYNQKKADGQLLVDAVKSFEHRGGHQQLGYLSVDMCLQSTIRLSLQEVSEEGYRRISNGEQTQLGAMAPRELAELGEIGKGRSDHDQIYDLGKKAGTSADYWTARIARDRPDILARMQAGEFPSVRQARIAAGMLREVKKVEIRETDTPEKIVAKLARIGITVEGSISNRTNHAASVQT